MRAQNNGSDRLEGVNGGYEDDLSFSTENRFQFSSYAPGSSQTIPIHHYHWSEDTFTPSGGKVQQNLNTVQSFNEDRQAPEQQCHEEIFLGSNPMFGDKQSQSDGNSSNHRSTSESVGMQDMSNSATSRNAMGTPLFVCSREECHGKQFARHSELQRHEDRHNRPFMCPVSACNKRDFADKGSLQRHSREVHKSAKYFCPVPQCERHKRGFGRKYNLIGHNRRVHRGVTLNLLSPASEGASTKSYMQDDDHEHDTASDGSRELVDGEEEEDDDPQSRMDIASPRASSKTEKLKQKLRKLRAEKVEHDKAGEQISRDIKSVERQLLDVICDED